MTRSTRGSRPIVIDGYRFRWHIGYARSAYPDRDESMQVTVFLQAGGTSRLVAEADPWTYLPFVASGIKPGHVERIIRRALASGWDPAERSRDFRLADFAPIVMGVELDGENGVGYR